MNFIHLSLILFLFYVELCPANVNPECDKFFHPGKDGKIKVSKKQYHRASNCTWTIDKFSAKKITILSLDHHSDCDGWPSCTYETLQIKDKNGNYSKQDNRGTGNYCGKCNVPIVLKDGNIKVHFETTSYSTYSFTLSWKRRNRGPCSQHVGNLERGSINQMIPKNAFSHCRWRWRIKPGNILEYNFNITSDGWDLLDVLGSNYVLFNTINSEGESHWVKSVRWRPRLHFQDTGWIHYDNVIMDLRLGGQTRLKFNWKAVPRCGVSTTGENEGAISVVDEHYIAGMDCVWTIESEPGTYIEMTIYYVVQPNSKCNFDSLRIINTTDYETIRRFCRSGSEFIRLNGGAYTVRLRTNIFYVRTLREGLTITWKSIKTPKSSNNEIKENSACGSEYVPANPLCWKTSPTQQETCYLKVMANGKTDAYVMAHSLRLDDSKNPTSNKEVYGIRGEKINDKSFACLEFKCSGMLVDTNKPDDEGAVITPYIQVFVKEGNSCRRTRVNKLLERYNRDHAAFTISDKILGSNNTIFQMYSPRMEDPLGKSFGIFPDKRSCDESGLSSPAVTFKCKQP